MTVRGAGVVRSAKLDLAEVQALETAARKVVAFSRAFDVVFEVPEPAATKQVRCIDFLNAIEILLSGANAGLHTSTVYYLVFSPMPGVIPKGSASGASARIGDLLCTVMAGANECTLTKYRQDENGEWKAVSVEDIRNLTVLKTDTGEIEIHKRSKPARTISFLRTLKNAFALKPEQAELTITIG